VSQRLGVDVVELVPAVAPGLDQASRLQHVQMLRDCLARRTEVVSCRESRADLEERLTVALGQLVEDRPPRWLSQRGIYVSPHSHTIGKS